MSGVSLTVDSDAVTPLCNCSSLCLTDHLVTYRLISYKLSDRIKPSLPGSCLSTSVYFEDVESRTELSVVRECLWTSHDSWFVIPLSFL